MKKKGSLKGPKFSEISQVNDQIEKDNIRIIEDNPETESTLLDDFETQLSSNEPIRELLTSKNIKFKTELTDEQRGAVSVLYHAYKLCLLYNINFDGLKYVLDEYIDFGVAVDRKGRLEYVDAHKAQAQQMAMQQQMQSNNQMQNMKM